jgi:hypothetical protein
MSNERDDRDDAAGGGTHGGLAIGRTTGMGAGVARGGTPGVGEGAGGGEDSSDEGEGTSGRGRC